MSTNSRLKWLVPAVISASLAVFAIACGGGTERVEVVVEVEVTRVVPGAERTVLVPGAVRTVLVPGAVQTVLVPGAERKVVVVATPTAAPAQPPSASDDRVVVADSSVFPVIFVHALSGLGQEWKIIGWDIGENLLRVDANGEYDAANSIAKGYTVAPDQSSITFDLRDDVEFHDGWGKLTADDVAWSFNNAMREGSVFYRVGSLQPFFEPWEALNESTVKLNWKEGQNFPWWVTNFSQISSADPWMTSKKIVDQLGEAKASQVPVSTGPYSVETWRVGERMDLKAVPNHWRKTPAVETFTVLELREPATMVAAFKVGEIDFAPIPNSLLQDAVDATPGATKQTVGLSQMGCINFTGNYWQQKDNNPTSSTFGETIFPRPGFNPSNEWVGDPRDPASMEQARKVRRALSLAIDHDAINEELFGGFGGTQGTAVTGWGPGMSVWETKWERHFDPDEAKKLLTEAGYPNGFTIPLFVPADHPRVNPEAGEAIAQMWSDVGMKVDLDISAYAAARPRRFGGVDTIPWYHCGVIAPANADRPFDGGMGATSTFRGFEVEDHIVPLYFANFTEPSREKRLANNRQAVDYVIGWELQTAFVADRPHYAVGPNIASWTPHAIDAPVFTNAATVVVK